MLGSQRLLLLLDGVHLVIEVFFLLLQAALLLLQVARRSFTSFSYSLRDFKISSLASRSASLFLFSELLMASLMMRVASSSALEISFSATRLR